MNAHVAQAVSRFAAVLQRKGANALVINLPLGPRGTKQGPDDFLAARHTVEELLALATAEIPQPDERPVAVSVRLSTVTPTRVEWVWPSRLAKGKVTVVSGDPGLGKSMILLDVAARISRGADWPDRGAAPVGSVVILSAEDGIADTILPRLRAMGGDPDRIYVVEAVRTGDRERPFDISTDMAVLGDLITRLGDVVLVIIDPISAYLGKTDSHRDASMRGVLMPLAQMAERLGVAVAVISHLNKATKETARKALYRTQGSIAQVAAGRMTFLVGPHPDEPDPHNPRRRVLVHQKNNLAAVPATLGYQIVPVQLGVHDIGRIPRIVWESAPLVGVTADDVLKTAAPTRTHPAEELLDEILAGGPVPAAEALDRAEAEGISEPAMRRARKKRGVEIEKRGMGEGWWWLPARAHHPDDGSGGGTPEGVTPDGSAPEDDGQGEVTPSTPSKASQSPQNRESDVFDTFGQNQLLTTHSLPKTSLAGDSPRAREGETSPPSRVTRTSLEAVSSPPTTPPPLAEGSPA